MPGLESTKVFVAVTAERYFFVAGRRSRAKVVPCGTVRRTAKARVRFVPVRPTAIVRHVVPTRCCSCTLRCTGPVARTVNDHARELAVVVTR